MNYEFLYNECKKYYPNYKILKNGAIVAYSGEKTGRCPKDKRIVIDNDTKDIDWGSVNIPISNQVYQYFKQIATEYIDIQEIKKKVYIVDGYAGWKNKKHIRIICINPYHAIFMKNMLIDTDKEIYGTPDLTIYNVGELKLPLCELECEYLKKYPLNDTLVGFNFTDKSVIIFGTEYAGEIKKAVFTYMLYEMPKVGLLPLHSSANIDKLGNTTLFLGLSGTGKTTLSADDDSFLIGDDEHIWDYDGIYNIEGGCYAKCIGLDKSKEPQIYNAIKYGAILENVIVNDQEPDYDDPKITENTRCSYPLNFIENAKIPAMGNHPKNIIFLCCDSTCLLPAVCRLDRRSANFMFISGYTSKIAGTEVGVLKAEPTFSSCFAGPFIVWQPYVYGSMLMTMIHKYKTNVWLVNTGYRKKGRIPLNISRKIVNLIKSGEINFLPRDRLEYFDIEYVTYHNDIDDNILNPKLEWTLEEYNKELKKLYDSFIDNYNKKMNTNYE